MSNLALKIRALHGWRRLLTALLAGAFAATALPPLAFWPAMFVSIPLMIWLLDGVYGRLSDIKARMRPAFTAGWALGFGYFGVSLYWIGEAFLVDAAVFAWLLPFAVTAMPAGLALFWGLAAMLAVALWSGGASRVFVFAACFSSLEWLRGHVLTGLPWNAPAYVADTVLPIAQTGSLIGLYGLSFCVMLWAAWPALLASRPEAGSHYVVLLAVVASALAAFLYGSWRLNYVQVARQPGVIVRIVQPNIAQKEKWRPENRRWIYQRYLDMTSKRATGLRPNVVVWPESALPALIDEQNGTRQQIAKAAGDGAVTVLGSLRRASAPPDGQQGGAVSNSVLVLDDKGRVAGRYDKQKLVPFGEYLPFADVLEPLGLRKLVEMPAGFQAGPGPLTMHIAGVPPFAPLVCYEAIFPRVLISRTDRPEWLLNVTNDAWFGRSAGPFQHLAQARMRAIEEGLPLVRAANTGISAVIDSLGRVMHRLKLGQRGIIDAHLPAPIRPTVYATYGDWLFFCLIGLVAISRVRTFFANID